MLTGAAVDGAVLTLTFSEALNQDSAPAAGSFAVTVADTARTVDGVALSQSAVELALASAVAAGETVTVSAPWRTLPRGITSSSRPPTAVQSRRVSSSSLSDWLSQSARLRPRSHWSRMMAATSRPLPTPVPSPSIQPRRKRTGADSVSPSTVMSSPSSDCAGTA